METNEALLKLGKWGKWHIKNYLLLCLSVMIPPAWSSVAIIYIGYKPEHHCKVPADIPLNQSIPTIDGKLSSCLMYKNYSISDEVIPCNNGWTYLGDDGPTIVTKWDLVCDRSHLAGNAQMIYFLGSILGSIYFANLSDRLGRKSVFFFLQWSSVVVGCVSTFIPNFTLFCVARFFFGALSFSIIIVGFILTCESFAAPQRTFVGTMIENFWALSLIALPLLAFLFKNWVYLNLFLNLFGLLTIPLYWLVPESLIWLEIQGKTEKAEKELQQAARMNKVSLPSPIYTKKVHQKIESLEKEKSLFEKVKRSMKKIFKSDSQSKTSEEKYIYSVKHLFINKTLRKYLILTAFLWFTAIMVYTGFIMSTGVLVGNHYVNGAISGSVEIPGYLASYLFMIKFGRRYSLIGFHVAAGVALICQVIMTKIDFGPNVDNKIFVITFNMLGKLGMAGCYGSLDLYAPELFPTTLRNQAQGIASVFGRLGTIASSFLPFILEKNDWIPLIFMAIMLIFGCLFVFLLPETIHRALPNSIEDIEAWTYVVTTDEVKPKIGTSTNELNDSAKKRKGNTEEVNTETYGVINRSFTKDGDFSAIDEVTAI